MHTESCHVHIPYEGPRPLHKEGGDAGPEQLDPKVPEHEGHRRDDAAGNAGNDQAK